MTIYSFHTPSSPLNNHEDASSSECQWAQQDECDFDFEEEAQYHEHNQESAHGAFNSWANDLDDQSLPDMDKDELRILHALLFGSGDDAFSVADGLLADFRTRQSAFLANLFA